MSVEVELVSPLPELSAATEVTAYRIVNEAVTNAVRHSGGRRCTVRLTSGALTLDIQDDGTGLAPEHHPGHGLRSVTERARELGGTVEITAAVAAGTRVLASLPLERS